MRSMRRVSLSIMLGLSAGAAAVTPPARDFSRYQPIIDRMPFGGGAESVAENSQAPFASRFTLVGMVSAGFSDGKLQVILLDKSAKNKTYFRSEGEAIDGVKIIKINQELPNRSVVLQQGLETATLKYEAPRTAAAPTPTRGTAVAPDGGRGTPAVVTSPTMPRRIPFRR